MMIAVQTIRATNRAPSECAMSAWTNYHNHSSSSSSLKAMTLQPMSLESAASAYLGSKKRKRDTFEAYDFQAHRQQRMRYSLLRGEQPEEEYYLHPSTVHPQNSLEQLADNVIVPERQSVPSSPPEIVATDLPTSDKRSLKSDSIRRTRRRKKSSSSSSSKRSSSHHHHHHHHHRRTIRMTKKHYNKKKRLEMMEATDRQIENILASCSKHIIQPSPRLLYVLHQAEQLDLSLRHHCNSIVQKEQDIKSWLGVRTSNKSKIVSLRKRLHDRWAEVKDLQSEVKPKRQRLKNLKFAARCEELSILEE